MAKKGYVHNAISLLFQQDGVPTKIIVDGPKEQTQGYFKRKVAEAGCHLRRTEPESPRQMYLEERICELKRGSGRNMTKMKSPKVLWDDCLELEAYIRSNMALDVSELGGMTPKTKMSG